MVDSVIEDGDRSGRATFKGGKPVKGTGLVKHVNVQYLPMLGLADPLIQMFEYHGQSYNKQIIEKDAWDELRGTENAGEFQSLPIITVFNRGRQR